VPSGVKEPKSKTSFIARNTLCVGPNFDFANFTLLCELYGVNTEPRLHCQQPDRALATLCIDSNIFNQLNINHDGAVAVSKMITCDGHLLLCLTAHIVP